jgi:hypothetical protein
LPEVDPPTLSGSARLLATVSGSPIAETGHADLVDSLPDGRQALSVAELEAIDRLAALIPPPAAPFCS